MFLTRDAHVSFNSMFNNVLGNEIRWVFAIARGDAPSDYVLPPVNVDYVFNVTSSRSLCIHSRCIGRIIYMHMCQNNLLVGLMINLLLIMSIRCADGTFVDTDNGKAVKSIGGVSSIEWALQMVTSNIFPFLGFRVGDCALNPGLSNKNICRRLICYNLLDHQVKLHGENWIAMCSCNLHPPPQIDSKQE